MIIFPGRMMQTYHRSSCANTSPRHSYPLFSIARGVVQVNPQVVLQIQWLHHSLIHRVEGGKFSAFIRSLSMRKYAIQALAVVRRSDHRFVSHTRLCQRSVWSNRECSVARPSGKSRQVGGMQTVANCQIEPLVKWPS